MVLGAHRSPGSTHAGLASSTPGVVARVSASSESEDDPGVPVDDEEDEVERGEVRGRREGGSSSAPPKRSKRVSGLANVAIADPSKQSRTELDQKSGEGRRDGGARTARQSLAMDHSASTTAHALGWLVYSTKTLAKPSALALVYRRTPPIPRSFHDTRSTDEESAALAVGTRRWAGVGQGWTG